MTILIQTGTVHEHAHYSCVIYFECIFYPPCRYVKQYFFLEYFHWKAIQIDFRNC